MTLHPDLPSPILRPLVAADARIYFALRLGGLEESPLAFGRSAEEYRREPLETVAAGLDERPGERVTFGAFLSGELVGVMTLLRDAGLKKRHKAVLIAVYVAPAARGLGIGGQLLAALLDWAGAAPGLLQVRLSVSVTQTAARRLYAAQGFRIYGLESRALKVNGQDVDDELMMRVLDK